jgi:predicted nucleic acid-binding protein
MSTAYLLDVSPMLALLWAGHQHHRRAKAWMEAGPALTVCPLTELGFLRISTQPAYGATFEQAKRMLSGWKEYRQPRFIPCDVSALNMDTPSTGRHTTDYYLASLAAKHGLQLATLDEGIKHKAVFLIPP